MMNIVDDINTSGIYYIKNRMNGRVYIGLSDYIPDRIGHHEADLRRGAHHNAELQSDFQTYGEAAFDVGIIQEVDNYRDMRRAELMFIRAFKAEHPDMLYNTTPATTRYAKRTAALLARLTWLELAP